MKRKLRYAFGLTMMAIAGGGGLAIAYVSATALAQEIDRLSRKFDRR